MDELRELDKIAFNNMTALYDNEFNALIGKYREDREDYVKLSANPDKDGENKLKNRYTAFNQTLEEYIEGKNISNNIEIERQTIEEEYEGKTSSMMAA